MIKVKIFNGYKHYGLKTIDFSLLITPGLRPGLLIHIKNRALALNSSLILSFDTPRLILNRLWKILFL
jgi:hypothetical protein